MQLSKLSNSASTGCEVVVTAVSKLKEHMRCHSQEKLVRPKVLRQKESWTISSKVGCPTCGALFATRGKFLDHVKRQNSDQVATSRTLPQIWNDILPIKVAKLHFPCETCGKSFPVERLLKDHMRSHVTHHQVSVLTDIYIKSLPYVSALCVIWPVQPPPRWRRTYAIGTLLRDPFIARLSFNIRFCIIALWGKF